MPIRQRLTPPLSTDAQEKTKRLVQEWQNPQENPNNPIIIEEGDAFSQGPMFSVSPSGGSGPSRIYVIWHEWQGMDQIERSGIIMDAFKIARGEPAALQVTMAMGLTAEEAGRLGIAYA